MVVVVAAGLEEQFVLTISTARSSSLVVDDDVDVLPIRFPF